MKNGFSSFSTTVPIRSQLSQALLNFNGRKKALNDYMGVQEDTVIHTAYLNNLFFDDSKVIWFVSNNNGKLFECNSFSLQTYALNYSILLNSELLEYKILIFIILVCSVQIWIKF